MLMTLLMLPLLQGNFEPSPIRTIYIAPMSHLDIGFTAPPTQVAEKMRRTMEQALAFADADPNFVWTVETFWQLERWLETNPTERQRQRLLRLLRSGRFELGAAYVNPHSNAMSAFLLDWLFRLPHQWADKHQIPITTAILNDVPGHPIDLPHFLARNGIRYLVIGANLRFSPPLPRQIASTPFWWEAPTGERVLTWISDRSYTEAFHELGIDPDSARIFNPQKFGDLEPMRAMEQGIAGTLQRFCERRYPYDAILVLHAFDNWDATAASKLPRFVRMWNEHHETPRLVLATPRAFFEHIERRYGNQLPVYRGGFGGQWESFVRPAIPTAMRRARFAEQVAQTRQPIDLDLLRRLLVFYEHSFGMGPPWANLMSRKEAIQHNREQWQLLQRLPMPTDKSAPENLGVPESPPNLADGELRTGALYWLPHHPMLLAPKESDLRALRPPAWVGWRRTVLPDGRQRFCYWIDRRRLPADPICVVGLWELDEKLAKAKLRNRTATGWETLPDDRLAGYDWGGWFSPFGFRLGEREFIGDGIWAFRKVQLQGRWWLMGICLTQQLRAVFKGGEEGALTFDEAYPGEEAVVALWIDLRQ
ncbi:MAG: hypothetical protein SLRJCFUN_000836 [Candidatus Fervidibacter sp.]